ncbi:MAG: ABC transporter ATP-binding protein [Clostridiales Family XIII bacterium]|jgi:multidrug/hemolysin transport system ATP-binding protein|nr:ABC transporter ATP-binding protein [Clostridiales Family XIII bacterium]
MAGNILAVSGLAKAFSGVTAVDDLSFTVPRGSLFAFLGQNGAGKSTTINMLIGLLARDKGSVEYDGSTDFASFKNQIGVVFQNNVFDDLLSVEENLMLYGRLYMTGVAAARARYREIVELLSLGDYAKKRFRALSDGQKRKAEIARSLFMSPRLLFLDEPTTGLDPRTRTEVWEVMRRVRRDTDMTIFLTTHYMEETSEADKVVIIHKGAIVSEGSPAELKSKYSYDRLLLTPADPIALEAKLGAYGIAFEKTADTYAVRSKDTAKSIELLAALKGNLHSFEVVKGTMDDVFLNAVGENLTEGN